MVHIPGPRDMDGQAFRTLSSVTHHAVRDKSANIFPHKSRVFCSRFGSQLPYSGELLVFQ